MPKALVIPRKDELTEVPPYPELLPDSQKQYWDLYWNSSIALAADEVDVAVLTRLFCYRDELEQSLDMWQQMNMDERYEEQIGRFSVKRVVHPLAKRIKDLEKLVLTLEDKVGLSPRSRAQLGIEISHAALAWHDVEHKRGNIRTAKVIQPPKFNVLEGSGAKIAS